MSGDPYPEIGRILVAAADRPWDKIVLDATVGPDWSRFQTTSYHRGVGPHNVRLSNEDLDKLEGLLQVVQGITKSLSDPGGAAWERARFTLMSDGQFDVEFDHAS